MLVLDRILLLGRDTEAWNEPKVSDVADDEAGLQTDSEGGATEADLPVQEEDEEPPADAACERQQEEEIETTPSDEEIEETPNDEEIEVRESRGNEAQVHIGM